MTPAEANLALCNGSFTLSLLRQISDLRKRSPEKVIGLRGGIELSVYVSHLL